MHSDHQPGITCPLHASFFIGIIGCLYLGAVQKHHPNCWLLLHAAPLPNSTSRLKFVLRSVYDRLAVLLGQVVSDVVASR